MLKSGLIFVASLVAVLSMGSAYATDPADTADTTDTVATETINGITFVGKIVKDIPAKEIKSMVDAYKAQIKSGVVAILSENEGKVSIVIGVTADLTNKYDAVPLVKEAAVIVGGAGGGGRADIAQAGGNLPDKMEKALSTIKKHI